MEVLFSKETNHDHNSIEQLISYITKKQRKRLPTNTLIQTPQHVGAFSNGDALLKYHELIITNRRSLTFMTSQKRIPNRISTL
jgi:hypothetical protein